MATDTLRLGTAPCMGRLTSLSQRSAMDLRSPECSRPMTSARCLVRSVSKRVIRGLVTGAYRGDAVFGQPGQDLADVADRGEGHAFGGTRGHLAHGRTQAGRAVPRHDDGIDAGGVRGAQCRAEIMRIFDAVEDQQQQRRSRRISQSLFDKRAQRAFVERGTALYFRDDTLVTGLATDLLQARAVRLLDFDALRRSPWRLRLRPVDSAFGILRRVS